MNSIPKNAGPLLDKWNGGKAKLWSYNVSFQKLVLRLEKGGVKGNLHLACSPCLSIVAPAVSWDACRLDIQLVKEDELLGATFSVRDEGAGVAVECMGVFLEENVEPIY